MVILVGKRRRAVDGAGAAGVARHALHGARVVAVHLGGGARTAIVPGLPRHTIYTGPLFSYQDDHILDLSSVPAHRRSSQSVRGERAQAL